jgi:hypothetical protein
VYGLWSGCEKVISRLSPTGMTEGRPGLRRGLVSAVPSGLNSGPHSLHRPCPYDVRVPWRVPRNDSVKAIVWALPVVFGPRTLWRTWGTRPGPLAFHYDVERSTVWRGGIPHLAKNERDTPNFLHAALDKAACAPFIKEGRMKFAEPTKQHRKSGMWGTRGLWLGQRRASGHNQGK